MLQLDHVTAQLGNFTLDVDLNLAKGARLGVLGPSGCGKSTLLNVIAGFLTPDAGRVRIGGEDVTETPVPERPASILFQDGNLFPHLSVAQNVGLGLRPDLRLSAAQEAQVEGALAQVGLGAMGARKPGDLSGGQRSRVALARMLLRGKPLALLDEPFSALDPGLRREMLALMQGLCEERDLTLVMVSHDLRDVERLCTDLIVMEAGRIVVEGEVQALRQAPPEALRDWL